MRGNLPLPLEKMLEAKHGMYDNLECNIKLDLSDNIDEIIKLINMEFCFGIAMRITTNPALINQLCYLSPFLSLFFIAMVLHEPIVITTYIGLVLIVVGIVFNEYFVKKR